MPLMISLVQSEPEFSYGLFLDFTQPVLFQHRFEYLRRNRGHL